MKFSVDAVHSVARRVVRKNLTKDEVFDLVEELLDNGYTSNNINVEQYYEEGDTVIITKEMVDKIEDSLNKRFILETFNLPILGTLRPRRFDRKRIFLEVVWDKDQVKSKHLDKTNTGFLEKMGFNFIQPEWKEIPLLECDEEHLDADEIILKNLMIDNDWTQAEAEEYLKPVEKAMNKAHAVFYQP